MKKYIRKMRKDKSFKITIGDTINRYQTRTLKYGTRDVVDLKTGVILHGVSRRGYVGRKTEYKAETIVIGEKELQTLKAFRNK